MFGKKARQIKEQAQRIAELEAKLNEREAENGALLERVQSFEQRERSIARALTDAADQAEKVVSDAQRQAGEILEQSREDSDAAHRDAEQIVDTAYQNARDIVREAETESQKRLDATQEQIESYAALLSSYDRLVQENIKTAEENARKFAELAARLHATVPQILSADGKLIEAPAMEADNEIPIHVVGEKTNAQEEKLWTVSELSKEAAEEMPVDELIDEILGASTARESSGSVR